MMYTLLHIACQFCQATHLIKGVVYDKAYLGKNKTHPVLEMNTQKNDSY